MLDVGISYGNMNDFYLEIKATFEDTTFIIEFLGTS